MPNPYGYDDIFDPFDSPGYYQQSSAMLPQAYPGDPRQSATVLVVQTKTRGKGIFTYWGIYTSKGYLRKRWWGEIQTTWDKSKASVWKESLDAAKWAQKHGYKNL